MRQKLTTGSSGIDPTCYRDDNDVERYVAALPSAVDNAKATAWNMFAEKIHRGDVNTTNYGEVAEDIADDVMGAFDLGTDVLQDNIDLHQDILQHVLSSYAAKP